MRNVPILSLASKGPIVAYSTSTVKRAAEIIVDNGIRRVPIVDAGTKKIRGIITTMDLVDLFGGGNKYNIITKDYYNNFLAAINSNISKIMTENVLSIKDSQSKKDVVDIMLKNNIGGCPIVDSSGVVLGIISESDLIKNNDTELDGTVGGHMSKDVITVTGGTTIKDGARLMVQKGYRRVPVVEDGQVVGTLRTYEILSYISEGGFAKFKTIDADQILSEQVKNIMNKAAVTIEKNAPLSQAAELMAKMRMGGFPVVDGKNIVGIITERDIFEAIYSG